MIENKSDKNKTDRMIDLLQVFFDEETLDCNEAEKMMMNIVMIPIAEFMTSFRGTKLKMKMFKILAKYYEAAYNMERE